MLSSDVSVTRGVPQGSVVGPILFSMAFNSLNPLCQNTKFIKYADDLTVLHFLRNENEDNLQLELNSINDWSMV